MRVLVTGAGGQLGRELVEAFAGHDVLALAHAQLDVGDRDAVLQAVPGLAPDVVVHAAAWTDVDGCEGDVARALKVNALGTRHVVQGARLAGARVVYVSTDYVFPGDRPHGYDEWDEPGPLSVYGRSKLGGERELWPDDCIVRTSWVNGRHGRNFVKTMLRLAAGEGAVDVVADQRGCPTFAGDLAGAIRRLAVTRAGGVYHVTNQGAVSWYELALDVFAAAGADPGRVRPVTTAELRPARPAPRPACSILRNEALRLSGMDLLPDHRDALGRLVKELLA